MSVPLKRAGVKSRMLAAMSDLTGLRAESMRQRTLNAIDSTFDQFEKFSASLREAHAAALERQCARLTAEKQLAVSSVVANTEAARRRQVNALMSEHAAEIVALAAAAAADKADALDNAAAAAALDKANALAEAAATAAADKQAALDAQAADHATEQAAAVAAARTSERVICAAEVMSAPVSGITVALTVFANSMRQQIRDYVAGGPH